LEYDKLARFVQLVFGYFIHFCKIAFAHERIFPRAVHLLPRIAAFLWQGKLEDAESALDQRSTVQAAFI
jgi:hypothetical protein